MQMQTQYVNVYIEIERGSNLKYEFNHKTQTLELDRELPFPYTYPYAYGFIPGTRADDGDELDIVLVTSKLIKRGTTLQVCIMGVLEMEDEKGRDEKLVVIPFDEYTEDVVEDIFDMPQGVLDTIRWFFTNYKTDEEGKWSLVREFLSRRAAEKLYLSCIVDNNQSS